MLYKNTFLLICLLSFSFCFAQNKKDSFPFFNDNAGIKYVYTDTAIIMIAPSIQAAVSDTIYAQDSVTVLLCTPYSENIRGIFAPWLKVIYKKNGRSKVGFVFAADFCIARIKRNKQLFSWGLEKVTPAHNQNLPDMYKLGIKVYEANKRITSCYIQTEPNGFVIAETAELIEKTCLQDVDCIISIHLQTKKKTVSDKYAFAYSKNKLIELPSLRKNNAAVPADSFTFPCDEQCDKNTIIVAGKVASSASGSNKMLNKKHYKWTGQKFMALKN